jgi:hypothetical protein
MSNGTYRGVVRGGTVVLLEQETPLAEGTEVLVTPLPPAPGTAAAVLAAVEGPPHVPVEWVDELEALIAAGRRPPTHDNPFVDDSGSQEGH